MRKLILLGLIVLAATASPSAGGGGRRRARRRRREDMARHDHEPDPARTGRTRLTATVTALVCRSFAAGGRLGRRRDREPRRRRNRRGRQQRAARIGAARAPGVKTVHTGAGGPIPSGATRSFTVETSGRFNRLSAVTMLVNTNDAFTGLDSLRLRGHGSSHETMAYDAGSEKNNELKSHIPGPCCGNPFVRDPEGRLTAPHEGITGRGELSPALYDWDGAAARITIERAS